MKYQIESFLELSGNEIIPCYEVTVRSYPGWLARLFGHRETLEKYVSDYGLEWFHYPSYQPIAMYGGLYKTLCTVPRGKRQKLIRTLFDGFRELKTQQVVEQLKNYN